MSEDLFEKKLKRLDEIVEKLKSTETSLSDTVKYYKEGSTLIQQCEDQLSDFETEVYQLREAKKTIQATKIEAKDIGDDKT